MSHVALVYVGRVPDTDTEVMVTVWSNGEADLATRQLGESTWAGPPTPLERRE